MFGGFLTENFGFKQSSTIMGIIAIIMVRIMNNNNNRLLSEFSV